jgi:hypothetical protein
LRRSIRSTDYRQLVFSNVVNGMKLIIDAMDEWEMSVESHNRVRAQISSYQPQISTREADLAECDICYDRNTSH